MGTLKNPSSFFSGGGKISGDIALDGDFQIARGKSISYPADSGVQTLVDYPVTDEPAQGEEQRYQLAINGNAVFSIEAEADGAGGVQNVRSRVPVDFVVDGDSTEVDDVITGDIIVEDGAGNNLVRFDATVDPSIVDFFGNPLENIGGTPGAATGAIRLGNAAAINARNSGDTGDVRLVEVDGNDVLQVGGANAAQVNMNPTLNFPNITGTPTFSSHTHDEGGLSTIPNAGLTNSSITIGLGNGIQTDGNGELALGETETFSVASGDLTGDYISASGSPTVLDVNIGAGLNGDGNNAIIVSPDDDTEVPWGTDDDVTTRYDSTNDDYRWRDGRNSADRAALDRATGDLTIEGELTEGAAL